MTILNPQLVALIDTMNDKPIAFNRHYVALGCGINGALMLSQMVYWSKRTKDRNGYFYKTQDEWEEETGLTRREQETARKKLRELGFTSECKRGVPCKVHFKVERDVLYKALIKLAQNSHSSMSESAKLECTNPPSSDVGIRQSNTENTTETTTDINNVFLFWKNVFKKTDRTKLEGKRLTKIKARLKDGYSVDEIKTAITNVSKSQWHVDNGQTDIELICRDQINLDKYLALKPSQPSQDQNQNQPKRRRFGNQANQDQNQMRTVGDQNS